MGSDDFTWVAQAIAIHREVGGNLAEVLDAVGHTIRERNAIRRQVKALSAEGKLSAIVLLVLPLRHRRLHLADQPRLPRAGSPRAGSASRCSRSRRVMLVGGLWLKKTVKIRF